VWERDLKIEVIEFLNSIWYNTDFGAENQVGRSLGRPTCTGAAEEKVG